MKRGREMYRAYRCILVLLFILMTGAQLNGQAASWPVETGFELADGYAVGALGGQNGWVTTNTVEVQAADKYEGEQAVELTSQSEALYSVTTPSDKKVWIEAFCKTAPTTEYPTLPAPKGVSCVLFFHADADKGITCLDGDGLGGGTWVYTEIQATEWTQIRVLQNYETHEWDLYVNGNRVLEGLGNAYNNAGFEKFECHASDSGSMYLDNFAAAAVPQYALTATTAGAGTGTVSKAPDLVAYYEGSTVTLTATPNADSLFSGWTGDVPTGSEMTNPLVVTMDSTKTLTANFTLKPSEYLLTVSVSPANSGTVAVDPAGASYLEGSTVTLTATPSDGYRFVNWSGDVTGTDPTVVVTMDANKTVTANFELLPTFELTLADSPAGAALTLTKTPTLPAYLAGASVTVATTPADGYTFRGWVDGVTTVSTEASFAYTMPAENKTLTAVFKTLPPDTFTVTVQADPTEGGTVAKSPDSELYAKDTQVTLNATSAEGYLFTGWFDGDTTVSTDVAYVYTVTANKVFTAKFTPVVVPTYALTLVAEPVEGGAVAKSPDQAEYAAEAEVNLTATPASGFEFRGWLDGATTVSTEASFKYTMPAEAKTLTAKFKALPPDQYTVAVEAAPTIGGTVSKSPDQAYYLTGDQVTLSAVPAEGYTFRGWTDGITSVSSEASFVYTVETMNKIFTAKFKKVPTYTVGVLAVPGNGGTVSKTPDQVAYVENAQVTLLAVPADGFEFRGWTDDATTVSTEASFLYTVAPVNVSFKANFKALPPNQFTVTAVADPANAGTATKSPDQASYTTGTVVTLTATENDGFKFVAWLDGTTTVSSELSFQYTVTAANKTFTAKFRTLPAQLPAPTNVQATVDTYSYLVKVTWNAVPDATHYQVLRSESGQEPVSVAFDNWIEGTAFADDSVVPGVTYQYTVKAAMDNAGERASEASEAATGRAKADPTAVANNYKVIYTKGMPFEKEVVNNAANLTFNAAGIPNASIKIVLLKKLPPVTTDVPEKGIAYLLGVKEIENLEINGDAKTVLVGAPVYNLAASGMLKSLTATAPVTYLSFREASLVKLSATKDASVPYYARTRIVTGDSSNAVSILTSGVVLEGLQIFQPVKAVKAATKTYKAVSGKTSSLGAIGLAQSFDTKAGTVASDTANGPSLILLGGLPGVTKTSVSVVNGSIVADLLEGCLDKVVVAGGNIRTIELVSSRDLRLLQAAAKKINGLSVGGTIGTVGQSDEMVVKAQPSANAKRVAIGKVFGHTGVAAHFYAGYNATTGEPNRAGGIGILQTKPPYLVQGAAFLDPSLVANLKLLPKTVTHTIEINPES